MVEDLMGPISGTFGTAAPYSRTEIWVCAGDDGWSDGLQDLMASPPSFPTYVFAGIGGDVSAYVGALSFSPPFSLFAIFFFEGGLFPPTSVSFPLVSAART